MVVESCFIRLETGINYYERQNVYKEKIENCLHRIYKLESEIENIKGDINILQNDYDRTDILNREYSELLKEKSKIEEQRSLLDNQENNLAQLRQLNKMNKEYYRPLDVVDVSKLVKKYNNLYNQSKDMQNWSNRKDYTARLMETMTELNEYKRTYNKVVKDTEISENDCYLHLEDLKEDEEKLNIQLGLKISRNGGFYKIKYNEIRELVEQLTFKFHSFIQKNIGHSKTLTEIVKLQKKYEKLDYKTKLFDLDNILIDLNQLKAENCSLQNIIMNRKSDFKFY